MTALHAAPATTEAVAAPATDRTRALLVAAAVAFPLWEVVSVTQALTRQGFDLTRHPLSALSNGALGWLQITNFLIAGALMAIGATGLRRSLAGEAGGVWVPRLTRVAGLGMFAAGIFRMDPADGYPIGTPAGQPATMSWHSVLHMVCGMTAFAAITIACFVIARHLVRAGQRRTAVISRLAGVGVIVGNGWAMAQAPAAALAMGLGVCCGMGWVAYFAAGRLRNH